MEKEIAVPGMTYLSDILSKFFHDLIRLPLAPEAQWLVMDAAESPRFLFQK